MIQRVVVVLAIVLGIDVVVKSFQLHDNLRIVVIDADFGSIISKSLDLIAYRSNKDRVVGRHYATALGNQTRLWNVLVLTYRLDRVNHVVSELLNRIVH